MRELFPRHRFDALLFDMDGTLLSSVKAAERVWGAWAARHGLDVAAFLPTIHGVQAVETIRRLDLPGVDPEAEAAAILQQEMDDVAGIEAIPGARRFLAQLPASRWAVVTSAPRRLAQRRLAAAGLPEPAHLVVAEDVERSKPAPDGFVLAAERLGVCVGHCLVLEDSVAGIAAAEAAGANVLVVSTTHERPLAHAHPSIDDYAALDVVQGGDGRLQVHIDTVP